MNIQLSVTVWTVICFIVLMIILRNLLFKPVLKVMDERRERIKNAHKKKDEYDRINAEHEAILAKKQAEFAQLQQEQQKKDLDSINAAVKKAVETAREERIAIVDQFRISSAQEQEKILAALNEHADELSLLFAENLLEG